MTWYVRVDIKESFRYLRFNCYLYSKNITFINLICHDFETLPLTLGSVARAISVTGSRDHVRSQETNRDTRAWPSLAASLRFSVTQRGRGKQPCGNGGNIFYNMTSSAPRRAMLTFSFQNILSLIGIAILFPLFVTSPSVCVLCWLAALAWAGVAGPGVPVAPAPVWAALITQLVFGLLTVQQSVIIPADIPHTAASKVSSSQGKPLTSSRWEQWPLTTIASIVCLGLRFLFFENVRCRYTFIGRFGFWFQIS